MAVNYTRLFDRLSNFAQMFVLGINFRANIDQSLLDHMFVLGNEVPDSDNLANLIQIDNGYKATITGQDASYQGQMDLYLTTEGRDEAQSTKQNPSGVAEDIATFMLRDNQTVLKNVVSIAVTFSRSGDGDVTVSDANQFAKQGERITLTCIVAQDGATPATFSVSSKLKGNLTGSVISNGDQHSDVELGANVGVADLRVTNGTPTSGEWVISDQIILDLSSDEISIYLVAFRDVYEVILPNNSSPTISNNIIPSGSVFPSNPKDNQRFTKDAILYFFDIVIGEWFDNCT